MEIFVKCPSCKSRYSFVEEPVNGRLRFPVQCTNCGVDGTSEANEFIRKSLSGELEAERKKSVSPLKKIFRKSDDDDDFVLPGGEEAEKPPQTGLGIAGACVGGFAGMMLWFGITVWSGWELGIVAWAVGILAGLGARVFVPKGNFTMASVAALCAFVAIMGGQVLVLKNLVDGMTTGLFKDSHSKLVKYAKEASVVQKDEDIRKLFKKYPVALIAFRDEEERADSSSEARLRRLSFSFIDIEGEDAKEIMDEFAQDILKEPLTKEEIARFRDQEVPFLKEIASGKPSRAEYDKMIQEEFSAKISTYDMILESWSPYQLLWLFLGVGSAYKLAYNKSETEDV